MLLVESLALEEHVACFLPLPNGGWRCKSGIQLRNQFLDGQSRWKSAVIPYYLDGLRDLRGNGSKMGYIQIDPQNCVEPLDLSNIHVNNPGI